ncbi:MAG: ATP-binding protein [Gemmatimonadota bacterium]
MKLTSRLILGAATVVTISLLLYRYGVGSAVVLIALLTVGAALIAGRSIASSLDQLAAAARAMATGGNPRFPKSPIPEIETLAQALRQTNRELIDRFAELSQEKAATTAIVDAMGEGILAADARSRIVMANHAARTMLGYQPGAALPDLRTIFRVKGAQELVAGVLDGGDMAEREIELDGRTLSLHTRPLQGGGALLVLRDLTAVRRLEAVRRDFVANVSHELKTPLTSISGYAETLVAGDVDDDTREKFLATILSNAHRMQGLVDDLLDLSRIESGRWTPRPEQLSLSGMVGDAWAAYADRASDRGVTLTVRIATAAERVRIDPSALHQVLANLFDNAMRYVEADGEIDVAANLLDDMVEITVRDNGSGIPAEHLPRVFERFYRVDPSRSREEGGTGLGLAIVRHMIEVHGGQVAAESGPREGTTIRFTVPAS